MKRLTIICALLLAGIALGDIWVPPWGEPIYDSTFIDIHVEDDFTLVDVRSEIGVLKLINDDYLMTFTRECNEGVLNENYEIEVADSLFGRYDDNNRLQFRYLSHLFQEDTLRFSVHSQYQYDADDDGDALDELFMFKSYFRTSDDTCWEEEWIVEFPVYEDWSGYTRITSNHDLTVRERERSGHGWDWEPQEDADRGRNIALNHQGDHEFFNYAYLIELDNLSGVTDSLSDTLIYELTPEVRLMVEDLIVEETVQIRMVSFEPGNTYTYHMLAEINLNQGLANTIAPMWLWFPNDQTDAEVELVGLRAFGAWGNDVERWHEYDLEVQQGRVRSQDGFYIRFPTMVQPILNPNGYWYWTDPRLRVEVIQRSQGNSARFILITAPLDYSRIIFTIPHWARFTEWDSPFNGNVEIINRGEYHERGNSLIFSGICQQPGIARVAWAHAASVEENLYIPVELEIKSVHPNPFNSSATISYVLPTATDVKITVYDMNGRLVETLEDDYRLAGTYSAVWNGMNAPTGMYWFVLNADSKELMTKGVLIK